jgi:hypothetical protein
MTTLKEILATAREIDATSTPEARDTRPASIAAALKAAKFTVSKQAVDIVLTAWDREDAAINQASPLAGLAEVDEQQRQRAAAAERRAAARAHAAARAEIVRIAQTTSPWDDRVASWSRADLSRITPAAAFSETPTLWACFLGGVRADVVSGEDWSHDLGMVGYGQWHLRPEWEQMTTAELVELAATLRAQLATELAAELAAGR